MNPARLDGIFIRLEEFAHAAEFGMIHVNLHGFPAFIRIFGFKSIENRPVFCQNKLYRNALGTSASERMKNHYRYMLLAIDRALKVD